jgi:two-component system cell cycle sensor histidine kinase/response regulator CckA
MRAMKDRDKTKEQLVNELGELRQQIAELEAAEAEREQVEKALRDSEERYRATIDAMDEFVHVVDRDLRIILSNETFREIITELELGHDLVGQELFEALPFLPDRVREEYEQVLETGEPLVTEETTEVGTRTVWTNTRKIPIVDERGGIDGILTIIRDITGYKQAEETLRESEERYRTLIETSADAISLTDLTGRFLAANRHCLELYGFDSLEEIQAGGLTAFDFIIEEDRQRALENAQRTLEEGSTRDIEYTTRRKDGTTFPTAITASVILGADGSPRALMALSRDITEQKRTEEALRENKELLNDILTASSVGIAHAKDRTIVWANEAMAEMFGFTAEEEYLGKDTDMLYASEEEYRRVGRITYEQQRAGKVAELDARFKRQDGSLFDGYVKVNALNPRDPIQGIIVSIIDITKRKQAERALRESETRFRTMFKYAPFGVALINIEGHLLLTNLALQDMLGYSEDEFNGMDFSDFTDPDDAVTDRDLFDELLEGKRDFYQVEKRLFNRGGDIIWTSLGISIIRDVTGEPQTALVMMKDITERKLAAEERERLLAQIQGQAQRMQQILETVPEGVLLLDADEQIALVNPVAARDLLALADARTGDTLTHLGGRPLADLLTSPPKGLWHEVEADDRSFQVIARPIENGPTPAGWVVVIRDVTQQRQIQQRVQQQERLAAVGQLAAGIAHDFNNIMATIVLYAQMTERTPTSPDRIRERMRTIDQQAKHAANLIQQILDFSRRAMLERLPLDLVPFLKEQVQLLERTLPENIAIAMDYGTDEYTVHADPTRIQQVVMNLALNARDAMPEGGDLRIGLGRTELEPGDPPPLPEMGAGEWIQMTVSDTGTGIPPDVLSHVFDPFFTTKGPGEGSGLGLAQVHGIVGAHEGYIDVQSRINQGTVFTIYLPGLPAHPSETPAQTLQPLVKGRGEIILVVEDNATTREALVESLELLNYGVLEATNGQEALMMLEQYDEKIALVLSDVVMPELGGIALLRTLRERGLSVPVVMLTGHPLEREMEDLRTRGMTDWLPKPPRLRQLSDVVARALGRD